MDNYLSVAALAARVDEVELRVRRVQAAVSLIRALGGGWSTQQLPNEQQTLQVSAADYGVHR